MTIEQLQEITIEKPSSVIYADVKAKWDKVAKPLDGLGDFETIICRIGAIQRRLSPQLKKRAVVVMIADHGIVEEGVSQSGQDVTLLVAKSMGRRMSSVCKMAKAAQTDVFPIDIGINSEESIDGVISQKVARGTRNYMHEPAMTKEEAQQAITIGFNFVKELLNKDYNIIATGEMGIGNTTTSTIMAASLLREWDEQNVGRGAGLTNHGLKRKKQVIDEVIAKYDLLHADPFDILCNVGGLEIAGLCGIFLGGAVYHIPVVIDGLISATAALLAERLFPGTKDYCIASHLGREPMVLKILEQMEQKPIIGGQMALGEGTGAVMLFPLLDMAMALYEEGEAFEEMHVEQYIRESD